MVLFDAMSFLKILGQFGVDTVKQLSGSGLIDKLNMR